MYTKEEINELYERIVKNIDISSELFDTAETAYEQLGQWINNNTPEYDISVYSQGSFALGTVIKPISDADDYDLDLVCEFADEYGLAAKSLKIDVVKPLLESYKKTSGEIINKRRCWHVEYEEIPNFHMDVIPAINKETYINITNHDEETDTYNYIGSNPKGYIEWFNSRKAERRAAIYNEYVKNSSSGNYRAADIEKLKEYHFKTPLQKAIQILKRHRDVMFEKEPENLKPISIIITTIAADLYRNEDNIFDTLCYFLNNAEEYIESHKIGNTYHIDNPCYTGNDEHENFADKWNEHPERRLMFSKWLNQAKVDLINPKLFLFNKVEMADNLKKALGEATTIRAFSQISQKSREAIKNNEHKIEPSNGAISSTGNISIPRNHHYGK